MKRIAVYPGTFDPVTIGHIDIIRRVQKLYDEVIVVILEHPSKKTMFSIEERLDFLTEACQGLANVEVASSKRLAVDYAKEVNASVLIRGLRASMDFEYELQIAAANQYLDSDVEMLFLMARPQHSFISSSNVKEMAYYGRDVTGLVTKYVADALLAKNEK